MKKRLVTALIGSVILSLAACGTTASDAGTADPVVTEAPTAAPEEPKEEPQQNVVEEEYHIEPPVFEQPKKEVKDDDLDTISVQKTPQNQNIFEIDEADDDDDNPTSGINIDFE